MQDFWFLPKVLSGIAIETEPRDSLLITNLYIMEDLFSTNINVNSQNINYRVIFENEKYVFVSEGDQREYPTFSFKREHDEWLDQELLPTEIKDQAIDALEKYLLRQL